MRVTLITEIISPYRVAPFNELARTPDIDLDVVFFAETEARRQWSIPRDELRFPYRVLPSFRVGTMYQGGSLFLNPGIVAHLLRSRPDALICGGWHQPTIWLAILTCLALRIPYIVWSESTLGDHRSRSRLKSWIKNAIVRKASGYVVPGRRQREYLIELGADENAIAIAPNAVDNRRFAAGRATHRPDAGMAPRPVVLFVGRLIDEKGVPEIIEVARRIEGARFLIVGDGPAADRYRGYVQEKHVANVEFAGFRDQPEMPAIYANADIFLFPTHSDPWGLVLNEAMAAGLPVVCSSAAGAAPDLVVDGENGFLVDPGDVDALTVAVRELVEDETLRERFGSASRARIAGFTPRTMAEGFVRVLRAAVGTV